MALFPGGEIRGQIRPDPYVFGYGGPGTGGRSRIGATGYGLVSGPQQVTITLTNAQPTTGAYLFVGGNSHTSTVLGVPLPLAVPPLGIAWIDANPAFFITTATDATGCGSLTFSVPPGLVGFKAYAMWASNDPINGLNLVLSDALELTVIF